MRPNNLVVDEVELEKFVWWLPELEEHQAYLVQLMIRSRGLKERYGFKGTDHLLMFKAVHGYLRAKTPTGEPYWRIRLIHDILRLGLLGAQGTWEYANYEPGGSDRIRYLLEVPWQLIALYININPADTVKALQLTVKELVDALYGMARSDGLAKYRSFFRRPDQRYYANLARSTRTRFHIVDLDTKDLFSSVLELYQETFGYVPPRIMTRRGGHIIIDLDMIKREGKERLYVSVLDKEISATMQWYKSNRKSAKADRQKLEEAREKLLNYVYDNSKPFFHRMKVLSMLFRNEKDAPLVELKKQALEPVPGALYKGEVIVRFYPEER